MIEAVKQRLRGLGVDFCDGDTDRLKILVARTVSGILAECNLDALPSAWEGIAAERAAGAFLQETAAAQGESGTVCEIREGDAGVVFDNTAAREQTARQIERMVNSGAAEISRARRLVW